MNKKFWLKKVAGALVITALIKLLVLPFAAACPYLICSNFTSSDKRNDCEYITSQDLTEIEEQEVLCILWEQGYDFDSYEPPNYPPLDPDLSLEWNEIDTSSFILAFKIVLFLLFNYFLYCVLTKPKWVRKWLAV